MNLIEISSSDKEKYNQFVATQISGSFLQSWEWGSWQEKLGRRILRYWILDDIGGRPGSVQAIVMPLPLGKFYIYIPYGPVIPSPSTMDEESLKSDSPSALRDPPMPLRPFDHTQDDPEHGRMGRTHSIRPGMTHEFVKELQKKFPDAVFIRIEPKASLQLSAVSLQQVKSSNIQPSKTLLIDLTKSEDQLLSEMHHKTRYNTKLAQKHGVEVQDEFGLTIGKGLFTKESLELIYQTSKRQGYMAQDRSYFSKLVDFFAVQNNNSDLKLHIYKALYQKELLASGIMVDFGSTRTYLFGGSSDQNKNIMASYLLHWKAMMDAKAAGVAVYDFWGIETSAGDTPGFVRFKLGFAPQLGSGSSSGERVYPGAYDVIQNHLQYKIYKSMRALNKLRKKIPR